MCVMFSFVNYPFSAESILSWESGIVQNGNGFEDETSGGESNASSMAFS